MKLGRVAEQLEAFREAIEAYEQSELIWQTIHPMDPERALCANLRGLLYLQLGEHQRARDGLPHRKPPAIAIICLRIEILSKLKDGLPFRSPIKV